MRDKKRIDKPLFIIMRLLRHTFFEAVKGTDKGMKEDQNFYITKYLDTFYTNKQVNIKRFSVSVFYIIVSSRRTSAKLILRMPLHAR